MRRIKFPTMLRKTLEKLVEAVKVEIAQNNEKLGVGMFS